MSQLNQYIKQTEAKIDTYTNIVEIIEKIQSLSVDSIDQWKEIESQQQFITQYYQDLLLLQEETGKRLSEKLNQVDPVTGEKRYGQQTQQKFLTAFEKLQTITQQFFPLYEEFQRFYQTFYLSFLEKERVKEVQKQREAELTDSFLSEQQREELESQEQLKRLKQQQQLQQEEEEQRLHETAESLRKKKLEEVQSLQILSDQIDQTLSDKINELNRQLSYQKGLLPQYTDIIRAFCRDNAKQFPLRQVYNMIITNVFERIIGKPDDANARKLRIDHPVLQTKLTGVRGTIQLLIIAGFRLQLKLHSTVSATPSAPITISNKSTSTTSAAEPVEHRLTIENKSHYEQSYQQLQQLQLEDHLLPLFSPLLYPHTKWELFLEMEEPPIDDIITISASVANSSEVKTKKMSWIEWYDALKEYLEIIRIHLSP